MRSVGNGSVESVLMMEQRRGAALRRDRRWEVLSYEKVENLIRGTSHVWDPVVVRPAVGPTQKNSIFFKWRNRGHYSACGAGLH